MINMKKTKSILLSLLITMVQAQAAFADTGSEAQLGSFLQGIADFLIQIVGPAVLVIGVCLGGVSMATGDERGVSRGIMAALGGALIMMSRAILALIQRLSGF